MNKHAKMGSRNRRVRIVVEVILYVQTVLNRLLIEEDNGALGVTLLVISSMFLARVLYRSPILAEEEHRSGAVGVRLRT